MSDYVRHKALFRGKCTDTGEWVYGDLRQYVNIDEVSIPFYTIDTMCTEEGFGRSYEVLKNSISWWTGMTDKNGKKIFGDDIVSCNYFDNFVVTYCNGEGAGLGMACGWYIQRNDFEQFDELVKNDDLEVVGNIHDNPELLQ